MAATASRALAAGYLFALFNLLAYTSNALLDRVMMSSSKQSAAGMAMYTQALSIPICLIEGGAASALGAASLALAVLGRLGSSMDRCA